MLPCLHPERAPRFPFPHLLGCRVDPEEQVGECAEDGERRHEDNPQQRRARIAGFPQDVKHDAQHDDGVQDSPVSD